MKRNAPGLTIQGHFLKWIQKSPSVWRGFCLELMGGVEQISNSETVEISRKERRPSHGVFKSVSNHRYI